VEQLQEALEQVTRSECELQQRNRSLQEKVATLERENQRYRGLFEGAPDGYLVTSLEGVIDESNRVAGKLLGVPPAQLKGRLLGTFLGKEELGGLDEALESLKQQDRVQELELQLRPRNAPAFPGLFNVSRVKDSQGKSTALRWLLRDITRRKQTEALLRQSEARNHAIVNSAAEGILTVDESGLIVSFNPAAQEIFRYTPAEVIGQKITLLAPSPFLEEMEAFIQGRARGESLKSPCVGRDVMGKRKDGSIFPIKLTVSEFLEGGRRRFSGIVRDITERKRAEKALRESEEHFRNLIEGSLQGVFIHSSNWKILFVNQALADMFGYGSPDELVTLGALNRLYVPHEQARLEGYLAARMQGNPAPSQYEIEGVRKDGSIVTTINSVRLIRWKGQPAIQGTVIDISERKRADEVLARRDAIMQAVNLAAGKFLESSDWTQAVQYFVRYLGETTQVSRVYVYENLAGEEAKFLTKRRYKWVAPGVSPHMEDPNTRDQGCSRTDLSRWRKLLSRGEIITGAADAFPQPERELLAHQSIQSILAIPIFCGKVWWGFLGLDECSRVREWSTAEREVLKAAAGMFGLAIERKLAEDAAMHHQAELAHVTRLSTMGEMASGLAHELNQPLAAISSYCDACLRMIAAGRGSSEKLVNALTQSSAQAQRAGEIIRRLRNLVRKTNTQRTHVELAQLMTEVVELAAAEARRKGVRIALDLDENLCSIMVDVIQIEQVMLNLVCNGIEAIDNARLSVREVKINAHQLGDDQIQVGVVDTGPGIDDQLLKQIFEPFYTTKPGGMGMGLAISRSIVESHNGRLWAESEPGKGAAFRFTLPTAMSHDLRITHARNAHGISC
jgi:PAS domain S-box-containing protein